MWGVEPVVTHQTSWLKSQGVRDVQQNAIKTGPVTQCFWIVQDKV